MSAARQKALAYLRDGKVRVLSAFTETGNRPGEVVAHVEGFNSTYIVSLDAPTGWTCTCRMQAERDCAHRAAVQLVTGHPSAARKPRAVPA